MESNPRADEVFGSRKVSSRYIPGHNSANAKRSNHRLTYSFAHLLTHLSNTFLRGEATLLSTYVAPPFCRTMVYCFHSWNVKAANNGRWRTPEYWFSENVDQVNIDEPGRNTSPWYQSVEEANSRTIWTIVGSEGDETPQSLSGHR